MVWNRLRILQSMFYIYPANIYLFQVTIEILKKGGKCVFIANFEHIWHLFLVFLLLTWNKQMLAGY